MTRLETGIFIKLGTKCMMNASQLYNVVQLAISMGISRKTSHKMLYTCCTVSYQLVYLILKTLNSQWSISLVTGDMGSFYIVLLHTKCSPIILKRPHAKFGENLY